MVAPVHGEIAPVVGKGTFLHIFHVRPVDPYRYLMLRLAGYRTGVAADALAVIDDEAVIHSVRACINFLIAPGVAMIFEKVPMVRSG